MRGSRPRPDFDAPRLGTARAARALLRPATSAATTSSRPPSSERPASRQTCACAAAVPSSWSAPSGASSSANSCGRTCPSPAHPTRLDVLRQGRCAAEVAQSPRLEGRSAGALGDRVFTTADFQPVAAVDRLDVEDLSASEAKHTLHRGRHVLVHPIRELDDDDGAFPRCSDKAAGDGARTLTELAEDDFHSTQSSIAIGRVYGPGTPLRPIPFSSRPAESSPTCPLLRGRSVSHPEVEPSGRPPPPTAAARLYRVVVARSAPQVGGPRGDADGPAGDGTRQVRDSREVKVAPASVACRPVGRRVCGA